MGCEHQEGYSHDCSYVEQRNRLLDAAERLAVREVASGPVYDGDDAVAAYGAAFLRAMDRLWTQGQDDRRTVTVH